MVVIDGVVSKLTVDVVVVSGHIIRFYNELAI